MLICFKHNTIYQQKDNTTRETIVKEYFSLTRLFRPISLSLSPIKYVRVTYSRALPTQRHTLHFPYSKNLADSWIPLDDAFFVISNTFHLSSACLLLCSGVSQRWKEVQEAEYR